MNEPLKAKSVYRLRVLPAGRNDRVVEISDLDGNIIKYLHSQYRLGNTVERREIEQVKADWESLEADEFAGRYGLRGGGNDTDHEQASS